LVVEVQEAQNQHVQAFKVVLQFFQVLLQQVVVEDQMLMGRALLELVDQAVVEMEQEEYAVELVTLLQQILIKDSLVETVQMLVVAVVVPLQLEVVQLVLRTLDQVVLEHQMQLQEVQFFTLEVAAVVVIFLEVLLVLVEQVAAEQEQPQVLMLL
tara:strand:- start:891 stop:1355 length:465 start_codon:yes stop_codon:yes gene_type:complete